MFSIQGTLEREPEQREQYDPIQQQPSDGGLGELCARVREEGLSMPGRIRADVVPGEARGEERRDQVERRRRRDGQREGVAVRIS